jgi:glyoxylase-like metal-dependent hydrolase (beta-lactamase superfamily II)
MIEVTGTAQQAAWRDNIQPPVEQVRPGLWSIPVPLPKTPLRYVLVYALELPDGVAIVDAGWDTPQAWAALTAGLRVAGFGLPDVKAILITHIHPDHYGLAGRVRQESGGWIGLHQLEADTLPDRYGAAEELISRGDAWLRDAGATDAEATELAGSSREMLAYVQLAEPDRLIEDGDLLPLPGWQLRAVWTPGHTPGHLCFHEERTGVLLSGDHVLPRISPNISAHPQQPPDPLRAYLDSLVKVGRLDVDEVLPAHEYRFRGLPDRVADLLEHHEQRLAELLALVGQRPGSTAWQLAERLSWSRSWGEILGFIRRAAVGETLAHLELLSSRGQVVSSGGGPQRWSVAPMRPAVPLASVSGTPQHPLE